MGHAHSHERNNMMVSHAGLYHALLTSHLSSSSGNELDIFFETDDHHNPQPMAFPVVAFKGTITKGMNLHYSQLLEKILKTNKEVITTK
jgi:hypothetical protein